jgi:hypothetical protein
VLSLWNEQTVLIDAEHASLLAPGVASDDRMKVLHAGDPATAVASLLGAVERRGPRWRNRLNVWLGYPWFHGQLLAWQPGLKGGDSHWCNYAQALLRERGITGSLRVRLGAARYGQARLAFAADATMLDALERKVGEQGWTVAGCRDVLSASVQRFRGALSHAGQCLVLAERTAMTCLWQSEQGWQDMITLQMSPGQSADAGIAAAQALCARTAPAQYGWVSTLAPQQLPPAAQARWLGFPHAMLAERTWPA